MEFMTLATTTNVWVATKRSKEKETRIVRIVKKKRLCSTELVHMRTKKLQILKWGDLE